MTSGPSDTELQYLDPSRVEIAGAPCAGMTIRAATGNVLGKLHGFLIDPIGRQLRYLVVDTVERTRLLPFGAARLDRPNSTIEVLADEKDFQRARDVFPTLRMSA